MKQVLLNLKSGDISVENVPVPSIKQGIVVENAFSLISAGTESSIISLAGKSYIGKAKERPDLANKMLNVLKKDGPVSAYQQAMGQMNKPEPLGYSSAGIVVQTDVEDFEVGDKVACAGAGYANHAEYSYVPKNLCVKVPEGVSLKEASFTTLGSIAMQGVRNARVSVGERVVVIGLGLIGLLTVQILKAAGCRVYGIDIDPQKIMLAHEMGADSASNYDGLSEKMQKFSEFGADAVIITAATKSNAPIELAGDLVRSNGRIVALGDVGMNIPRDIYYEKEAEFVVSRSYGPGRYDRLYEEKGVDYPILVRWTEKRNMEAFLGLIAEEKINIEKLVTHEYSIDNALQAYELIQKRIEPYMAILLTYETEREGKKSNVVTIEQNAQGKGQNGTVATIGCIGAGLQATSALYPNLSKLPVHLKGLATATGISAKSVAKMYGFEYCTTDYRKILDDKSIDAVLIATRNDLHARMTIEALKEGKDVFVEKPLAINIDELKAIISAWQTYNGRVQVGFNRAYSPMTQELKEFFRGRTSPMIVHYRVNAGQIPKEHWVHDTEQGGSMLISECCHFVDYLQYITGSKPVEVYARSIEPVGDVSRYENLQILFTFEDGSIGTITYTTLGDSSFSKEQVEVFCDNSVGRITDFRELITVKDGKKRKTNKFLTQEKGFLEELKGFADGNDDNFLNSAYSMLATFKAWESLEKREYLPIDVTDIMT